MTKLGKSCVLRGRKHPHHRVADSGDSAYVRKRAGVLATGQMTAWSGFECHGMPGAIGGGEEPSRRQQHGMQGL